MAEDTGVAPSRPCRCCWLPRVFGWRAIDPRAAQKVQRLHSQTLTDGLFLDTTRNGASDLEELRSMPSDNETHPDVWFVVQLQAVQKEQYINMLTMEQLGDMTSSVYGKLKLAQPLRSCSLHDAKKGTITLLASAQPSTLQHWLDQGCWPHMAGCMFHNFYKVVLVAPVAPTCRTAKAGLDSLSLPPSSGSE